ncbi:FAD-dependent oxidoreductase [Mycolicibacterium bacteremicum]|uniref:FAD-binding monooxygenase n=1 Tax=Mycolicibacterium bacteremicum TaxID=564198 RepID=A0A1W9YZG8_MYCBA|nr:FAD-dependent monooxygenase [Mycolicibacterium bacteremicum]MCV7435260.1 FAD-dependent monooxygenase [Mycolicibacterium bacteremicum]ORA05471.1 FAD-binding monooxygenase [Mycolicibacterium bacteremicum]
MRILVVGGGIGGLALAAGCRRNGLSVTVFERDTDIRQTGGYHITLDAAAQAALRQLVAPEIMERLLASASALRLRDRDAWWDHRGKLLGHGPDLGPDRGVDIDRITLRGILGDAVADDLALGRCAAAIGHAGDGTPTLTLTDGSEHRGDLLVGADGAHSIIAAELAGRPTCTSAGIIGFSGRTRRDTLPPAEQRRLGTRSGVAIGAHGAALYVGYLDPVGHAVLDAAELRTAVTTGPTYIWGAMLPDTPGAAALRALRGADLRDALRLRFTQLGWHRRVLDVIAAADPDSIGAFRFNAAPQRAADLAPWPAGRITALGDAVHATPPTAGMGAGAAIRDADSLVRGLVQVAAGAVELRVAVADFEADMRDRGAQVVTAAMRTVRLILATDTSFGAPATTAATAILAAGRRIRRRR